MVKPRRRFVATTDSDHDGPIFPNLAKDSVPTGPSPGPVTMIGGARHWRAGCPPTNW